MSPTVARGGKRSWRGGGGDNKRKRPRGGGGGGGRGREDFRWKKRKQDVMGGDRSGDAVDDDFAVVEGASEDAAAPPKTEKEKSVARKKREKAAKQRRRVMHEEERVRCERMIREEPAELLWEKYIEWVGDKLSPVEAREEKWTDDHVICVEERPGVPLIQLIKETIGPDYVSQGEFKKGKTATPGVACIALASSAVRAVEIAKSMYDGKPVGKLFSKHIQITEQRKWLGICCSKALAPTAAGTAKRVHRLIEEGDMTLKHTVALVIDFKRDTKSRNIVDLNMVRDELFEFIHTHVRSLLSKKKIKLVLYASNDPAVVTEPAEQATPEDKAEDDDEA